MRNLLPRFILDRLRAGERRGGFDAVALFSDLSGFTALTRRLCRHGPEGAEVLGGIINRVYGRMIGEVQRDGGLITGFAGDAVSILLPGAGPREGIDLARRIQRVVERYGRCNTRFGVCRLTLTQGLARGPVEWGIVGDERLAYYFKGRPLVESARLSDTAEPGEICGCATDGFPDLVDPVGPHGAQSVRNNLGRIRELSRRLGRRFLPEAVIDAPRSGEFRDVAPVFVGFDDRPNRKLGALVRRVLELTAMYGGYLTGIEFADKGPVMLVLFGAPVGYEDTRRRAAGFAAELGSSVDGLRCGLAFGTLYAGLIGSSRRCTYSVIGDAVNLAARLCQRAAPGEVLLDESCAAGLRDYYRTSSVAGLRLKGHNQPVTAHRLLEALGRSAISAAQRPLYGREEELERLRGFSSRLGKGRFAGVVLVHGDAGVGKSRLAAEVINTGAGRFQTVVLKADAILRRSLYPVVAFLRRFFNQTDAADRRSNRRAFEAAFQRLLDRSGSDDERFEVDDPVGQAGLLLGLLGLDNPDDDPGLPAEALFTARLFALRGFLHLLAQIEPLLLVVEDLQWIDADTRSLLQLLTRRATGAPLGLLVLSRYDDDGRPPVLKFDEGVPVIEQRLDELDADACRRLVEERLGAAVEPGLFHHLLQQTGGNPLYLEEFADYLAELKLLRETKNGLELIERDTGLPGGVRELMVARLDRLPAELRELVKTAAVLGREFDARVLGDMLERSMPEELLSEGRRKLIWIAVHKLLYLFRHALLREAAYAMMLRERLRELHAAAARAIEERYGDDVARSHELAHHYRLAEDAARELVHLRRAAANAYENYLNTEALELYRRLREITPEPGESLDARLQISRLLHRIGRWPEAQREVEEALGDADALGDAHLVARCRLLYGYQLQFVSRLDRAEEQLRPALEHFAKHGPLEEHLDALGALSLIQQGRGDFVEARHSLERAFEDARDLPDGALERKLLGRLGLVCYELGLFDEARRSLERAREACRRDGDLYGLCHILGNLGNIALQQRRLDEALERYRHSLNIAERIGSRMDIGHALGNIGIIHLYRFELAEARDRFDQLEELSLQLGNRTDLAMARVNRGLVLIELELFDDAEADFNSMLELSRRAGDKAGVSYARFCLGCAALGRGDHRAAATHLEQARELAESIQMTHYVPIYNCRLAQLHYENGDIERAAEIIAALKSRLESDQHTEARLTVGRLELLIERRRGLLRHEDVEKRLSALKALCSSEIEELNLVYDRWRLAGGEQARRRALTVFEQLVERYDLPRFRRRLDDLTSGIPDLERL